MSARRLGLATELCSRACKSSDVGVIVTSNPHSVRALEKVRDLFHAMPCIAFHTELRIFRRFRAAAIWPASNNTLRQSLKRLASAGYRTNGSCSPTRNLLSTPTSTSITEKSIAGLQRKRQERTRSGCWVICQSSMSSWRLCFHARPELQHRKQLALVDSLTEPPWFQRIVIAS